MLKLFFGNSSAIISTFLLIVNLGYMLWGYMKQNNIQKWGWIILALIVLNGVFWYFANVRDEYSNSIVYAVDKSVEGGLFSVSSIQSIIYWIGSITIWISGIVAIFKPQLRHNIFSIMVTVALIQIIFIEGSRVWLYCTNPTRFNYM
ncbi:hypothetical protein NSB24_28435 [Blautia coccoides]|uniref:Uncharacterized protein n=2 Tax=Blautia producta TaxID=33035 RepID=A0A7G5MVT1_9FIRM|nr:MULTISPECIES: hypothetical protein [Blautia]MDU5207995.1 hypothetical protein [Clostridioides difficile]MDU6869806.1 hypothetical protein [Enterococcus faecium]MCR1990105.1 hypothetical protein [Blautia coccoides]QIB54207.1 hypothetical protein GXM18_04630 [Blautia producta ATCC 27340 = DSM 2950]QMW78724.1 hypothetical protein E5259_14620 [Blautia producta]